MGDVSEGGADAGRTRALLKHCGVYYVQSPTLVHKLLDVDKYSQRWPLIPPEELRASSVQHPERPEWRWLLRSRRVPAQAPADLGEDAGSCGAT